MPQPPRPAGLTGTDALLALMVLVWGVNFIVLKAAMRGVEPLAFNAVRFTIATVCVAALAMSRGAPRPSWAQLRALAGLGLLGNTLYQFGFIEGVARTRAGNAALLMAAVPVQTAILSHVWGQEKLRARDVMGLLLSAAGVATIVLGSGQGVGGGDLVGDLMVFGATICWAIMTVRVKPLADALGPTTTTAWTMSLGAVPLVLLSLPWVARQDWSAVTAASWSGLVYSAVLSLALSYVIWNRGIQRLGPARTSAYSNFTPVVAMLAAWAVLGEVPNPWQLGGAGGIFAGIALTRT